MRPQHLLNIFAKLLHTKSAIGVFLVLSKGIDTIDHSLSLPLSKLYKQPGPQRENFSWGYEGRYRAPKSNWAPQALSGPMPLNHFLSAGCRSSFKSEGITIYCIQLDLLKTQLDIKLV